MALRTAPALFLLVVLALPRTASAFVVRGAETRVAPAVDRDPCFAWGDEGLGPRTAAGLTESPAEDRVGVPNHRSYRPGLGRWNQRDPAGHVDGLNLFRYSTNGPLNGVDPAGLKVYFLRGGVGASDVWIHRWMSMLKAELAGEETQQLDWNNWLDDGPGGQEVARLIAADVKECKVTKVSIIGQSRGGAVARHALQQLSTMNIPLHSAIFLDPVPTEPGRLPLKSPTSRESRRQGTHMVISSSLGLKKRPQNFWQFSEDKVRYFEPNGNILGSRALGDVDNTFFASPVVHWSDSTDGVVFRVERQYWGSKVVPTLR